MVRVHAFDAAAGGARVAAAAIAVALVAARSVGVASGVVAPPRAATAHRAAVVVEVDGVIHTAKITFAADSISGLDALRSRRFDPRVRVFGGNGGAVCALSRRHDHRLPGRRHLPEVRRNPATGPTSARRRARPVHLFGRRLRAHRRCTTATSRRGPGAPVATVAVRVVRRRVGSRPATDDPCAGNTRADDAPVESPPTVVATARHADDAPLSRLPATTGAADHECRAARRSPTTRASRGRATATTGTDHRGRRYRPAGRRHGKVRGIAAPRVVAGGRWR